LQRVETLVLKDVTSYLVTIDSLSCIYLLFV